MSMQSLQHVASSGVYAVGLVHLLCFKVNDRRPAIRPAYHRVGPVRPYLVLLQDRSIYVPLVHLTLPLSCTARVLNSRAAAYDQARLDPFPRIVLHSSSRSISRCRQ